MYSINTNVVSLQAQNYLRTSENFQNQTINEVTSGLRIVNSGDDAAGLAIANADRSNEAVLTQGIQNANNGLSQLQIADGGLSNISQLLDRARTLATESASGAFTGDRSVLNSEFQSVLTEVNRQAQAIGLNQGGQFATNLSVFVGGGTASGSITAAQNGTVSVNLSDATVDAKSLGLQGVQAIGVTGSDIGDGSSTSVQDILANSTNQASISNNTTDFYFTGPGFSDTTGSNVVKVAVNLTGVTNADTLVTAVNQAIQNAGNGASQQATAFKNANITAALNIDSSGKTQLTFNSSSAAFQVQGGDQVATALLGSFSSDLDRQRGQRHGHGCDGYHHAVNQRIRQYPHRRRGSYRSPGRDQRRFDRGGEHDHRVRRCPRSTRQSPLNAPLAATGIQAVARRHQDLVRRSRRTKLPGPDRRRRRQRFGLRHFRGIHGLLGHGRRGSHGQLRLQHHYGCRGVKRHGRKPGVRGVHQRRSYHQPRYGHKYPSYRRAKRGAGHRRS